MGQRLSMSDEPDAYQTYVLRLWRAKCQEKWQWRASPEGPHTGERKCCQPRAVVRLLERAVRVLGAPHARGAEHLMDWRTGPVG